VNLAAQTRLVLAAGAAILVAGGCRGASPTASRLPSEAPVECPLDFPGGFHARPTAKWIGAVVERAGYTVTRRPYSAIVAAGKGHEFFIWAVEDTQRDPHLPDPAEHQVLARVGAVTVLGEPRSTRWWRAQGYVVWLAKGPRPGKSASPPPDELEPLVEASRSVPALPPC
jgi:hypothetical protein